MSKPTMLELLGVYVRWLLLWCLSLPALYGVNVAALWFTMGCLVIDVTLWPWPVRLILVLGAIGTLVVCIVFAVKETKWLRVFKFLGIK